MTSICKACPHHNGRSAEGVGAAKRNNSLLPFVIPAKAGIRSRRSHKENRADTADNRLRIPAFAGMTSICKACPHHNGRSAESSGAAKRNNSLLPFVIPAKAGIRLRRSHKENRADTADNRLRIPAFAGMTSICKACPHHNGRSAEGVGAAKRNNSLLSFVIPAKAGIRLRRSYEENRADTADNRLRIPAFAGMTSIRKACPHHNGRSAEGVGAAKRNNSLLSFVIPEKAGIRSRRSHKENRVDTADNRLRIPAFAGMTSIRKDGPDHNGRSAESSGAAKRNNSLLPFVIPAKAGIRSRRSYEENRADTADSRLRIPAFAGMTSIRKDGPDHNGRSAESSGAAKRNNPPIILRHSRESGNPEADVRNIGPVFFVKTPPADSRFRGNDEYLYGRSTSSHALSRE